MKHKSLYDIEFYMEKPVDKWAKSSPSFSCMQKSFAEGAWAMLKSFYNHDKKYRLLKDGNVIDECSYQRVSTN